MSETMTGALGGPYRRVLLVGFMGSGKTRVGQALAGRLGWSFSDFDQEIESRLGLSIPEVFHEHGEPFFRDTEGRVGSELLGQDWAILASGGGWPATVGRMDGLPPNTLSVWLRVTAEEAVRRIREEGPTRPLLTGPDPLERARELLRSREAWYAKAHLTVDSEKAKPEDLARHIEVVVNEKGRGWASPNTPDA